MQHLYPVPEVVTVTYTGTPFIEYVLGKSDLPRKPVPWQGLIPGLSNVMFLEQVLIPKVKV
ncbi:hypothetical protein [Chryseobacterium wanjuense]